MDQLDPTKLPRHVAIIMDGNGRWARKRLLSRISGHREGANAVRAVVRCCRELGIEYLTLFTFSKENWQRPAIEIAALWQLLKQFLVAELPELIAHEIRVNHLGDLDPLPADVSQELCRVEAETAEFNKLVVNLALNYGARDELVMAAREFARDVLEGKYRPEHLTQELFACYLYTRALPEPDLLIRTSGECRISNFLLWQLAYTEIYFTNILWPDFREAHFYEALHDYQRRERRFGKTGEQVKLGK